MSEPLDDRYASFREFADTREEVSAMKSRIDNFGASLLRIEALLLKPTAPPAEHLNWQITAQRAMDMLERKNSGSVGHSILITLALIGVGVTAFVVGKVFF